MAPRPASPRRPASQRRSAATIPSTIWAVGTDPIAATDPWPTQVVARAITEFIRPGQHVHLQTWPTHKSTADTGPITAAANTVRESGRTPHIATPRRKVDAPDLIITSALVEAPDYQAAESVTAQAAEQLPEGGILVVFSRCGHDRTGALQDPTGATIAAAQVSDLLYLQHIIAVPIHATTIVTPYDTPAQRLTRRHQVVNTDVLVFLQLRHRDDT